MRILLSLIVSISVLACTSVTKSLAQEANPKDTTFLTKPIVSYLPVVNGDAQILAYDSLLTNKNIGLVINQSAIINNTHLIDTLIARNHTVSKIFAPEHGIRGKADAGEKIDDGKDAKTGISIVSLYGSHKKPTKEDLEGIDVVVFDLQDVGVRFYTYISTMHYVMEACAENNIPVIVLDRPNPNGDYIAGPVLDLKFQSFVGMHPIPIVHGLTVGELALMINGEKWLNDSLTVNLTVIPCKNYTHDSIIPLSIKPSPNLPNLNSIRWYPTLCLFEPTQISIGRGTLFPFEVYGSTKPFDAPFQFTPRSIDGMSKHPKFENEICYGQDLRSVKNEGTLNYDFLVEMYNKSNKSDFFTSKNFFYKLCGTDKILKGLEAGFSSEEITQQFETELREYKVLRKKYLLYPDFNER